MSNDIEYGKLTKRVVFTENDHRHAQLTIRLKHDNLRQSDFFRSMITGYLNNDDRILSYIDDVKPQSKTRKQKSKKLIEKGKKNYRISDLARERFLTCLISSKKDTQTYET